MQVKELAAVLAQQEEAGEDVEDEGSSSNDSDSDSDNDDSNRTP